MKPAHLSGLLTAGGVAVGAGGLSGSAPGAGSALHPTAVHPPRHLVRRPHTHPTWRHLTRHPFPTRFPPVSHCCRRALQALGHCAAAGPSEPGWPQPGAPCSSFLPLILLHSLQMQAAPIGVRWPAATDQGAQQLRANGCHAEEPPALAPACLPRTHTLTPLPLCPSTPHQAEFDHVKKGLQADEDARAAEEVRRRARRRSAAAPRPRLLPAAALPGVRRPLAPSCTPALPPPPPSCHALRQADPMFYIRGATEDTKRALDGACLVPGVPALSRRCWAQLLPACLPACLRGWGAPPGACLPPTPPHARLRHTPAHPAAQL